jgi:hypothetical protein
VARGRRRASRSSAARHESFLQHAGFRWLWVAIIMVGVATGAYLLVDVKPRPNGGSWLGYLLGTLSAGLIIWLSLIGIRKRAMTPGNWSLKAWTSAHVYLGLSLVILATLHTGFQLGWNVHSLAYFLMLLVIASGVVGVVMYVALPQQLSANRGETTQRQMLEIVKTLDRQLAEGAQLLSGDQTAVIALALTENKIGGGLWARLTAARSGCGVDAAIPKLATMIEAQEADNLTLLLSLARRKSQTLSQIRRHVQLRTLLEVWLKVHVPATLALWAALTAHIVSVFFYW